MLQNRKKRDILYAFNAAALSCLNATFLQLLSVFIEVWKLLMVHNGAHNGLCLGVRMTCSSKSQQDRINMASFLNNKMASIVMPAYFCNRSLSNFRDQVMDPLAYCHRPTDVCASHVENLYLTIRTWKLDEMQCRCSHNDLCNYTTTCEVRSNCVMRTTDLAVNVKLRYCCKLKHQMYNCKKTL